MSSARPPKIFISYSHDNPAHMARVLDLSDRLREDGVDADIDQYEFAPAKGWAMWMDKQISEADFVLIVCTETYRRRAEGKEEYGKGRGVIWECVLTYQYLYNAAADNTRFLPVVFEDSHGAFIPTPLQPTSHYCISSPEGYEGLYRRITNQPRVLKPPLGKIKVFDSTATALFKQPSLRRREHQKSILKFWNLPSNRNPQFTGREEVLTALRLDLKKKDLQAICGPGGMGKTEISIEYAYRHRSAYTAVLWTSADSLESISTGFSKIARLLDLAERDDDRQDIVVGAVKKWLTLNPGWLFIFDNADSPDFLTGFLPQHHAGHILITSRASDLRDLGIKNPIQLPAFSRMEARKFLLMHASPKIEITQSEDPRFVMSEADRVAADLSYMPLALEQAGAYISATQTSLKDYMARFGRQRSHL